MLTTLPAIRQPHLSCMGIWTLSVMAPKQSGLTQLLDGNEYIGTWVKSRSPLRSIWAQAPTRQTNLCPPVVSKHALVWGHVYEEHKECTASGDVHQEKDLNPTHWSPQNWDYSCPTHTQSGTRKELSAYQAWGRCPEIRIGVLEDAKQRERAWELKWLGADC